MMCEDYKNNEWWEIVKKKGKNEENQGILKVEKSKKHVNKNENTCFMHVMCGNHRST